jgi:putative endonuclease
MQPMRFVYVLESIEKPARHYVGLSSGVDARLEFHNAGKCRHTARHRPWRVLAAVEYADEARAVAFERYLKSGSGRAFARRHF